MFFLYFLVLFTNKNGIYRAYGAPTRTIQKNKPLVFSLIFAKLYSSISYIFFFKAYQIFCPLYDSLGESFHRCCCLKTGHVYHFKFDFPFWTISVHLSWDFLCFCLFLLSFFFFRGEKKNYMGSSSVKRSEFDARVIVAARLLFPPCLFDVALFSDRKGVGSDRTLKRDSTRLSFQCVLFYVGGFFVSFYPFSVFAESPVWPSGIRTADQYMLHSAHFNHSRFRSFSSSQTPLFSTQINKTVKIPLKGQHPLLWQLDKLAVWSVSGDFSWTFSCWLA